MLFAPEGLKSAFRIRRGLPDQQQPTTSRSHAMKSPDPVTTLRAFGPNYADMTLP